MDDVVLGSTSTCRGADSCLARTPIAISFFGINALQNDFITRDALISGMAAWALEKQRPLGDILVEKKALNPDDRAILDRLIDRHVARHGGDAAASLAALSSVGSVAEELRRKVDDPEILASIATVAPMSQVDFFPTRTPLLAARQPSKVRFRKVREHASGNLVSSTLPEMRS